MPILALPTEPMIETNSRNIPLNLAVGRSVTLGGKPWKLAVEANRYVERNDLFAAEWMIGFNVTPVIENPLAKLFEK